MYEDIFGFDKYSSVSSMLLQLGLPSFSTLLHNYRVCFAKRVVLNDNNLVQCVYNLQYGQKSYYCN